MTPIAWRRHRALLLRHQGLTYREIGLSLGVTTERARQTVYRSAADLLHLKPTRPRDLPEDAPLERLWEVWRRPYGDCLPRALYLLRMRAFNRHIARRAWLRTH